MHRATFDDRRHQTDFPNSKLNTELCIFCCTGRQKCTKLHLQYIFKNFPGPPWLGSPCPRPSPLAHVNHHSFRGRCKDITIPCNQIQSQLHLVRFNSRLATMLFIASKGFSSRAFVTHPSLAVRALSRLTRDPAASWPCPNTFFPVLSGGNADSIFLTMSTKACSKFTSIQWRNSFLRAHQQMRGDFVLYTVGVVIDNSNNKYRYERYYGPGRCPLAYLLYYNAYGKWKRIMKRMMKGGWKIWACDPDRHKNLIVVSWATPHPTKKFCQKPICNFFEIFCTPTDRLLRKYNNPLGRDNYEHVLSEEIHLTWFSTGSTQSACSANCFIARTLLYGDVMTSSSSDGKTAVTNLSDTQLSWLSVIIILLAVPPIVIIVWSVHLHVCMLFVREMHHYATCKLIPLQDDNKCIFETEQQGSKLHGHQQRP